MQVDRTTDDFDALDKTDGKQVPAEGGKDLSGVARGFAFQQSLSPELARALLSHKHDRR